MHPPSSGDPYSDRQLTLNFELWVEFFCVPTCFHMRIPKSCLSFRQSVCPCPEIRKHPIFVNISPTLVIDTSMERSSRVLQHVNPKKKFLFIFKEGRNWILTCAESWNHLSFVNIIHTLLIDKSMERSSRVLQHWNSKIWIFWFKKFRNLILTCAE